MIIYPKLQEPLQPLEPLEPLELQGLQELPRLKLLQEQQELQQQQELRQQRQLLELQGLHLGRHELDWSVTEQGGEREENNYNETSLLGLHR